VFSLDRFIHETYLPVKAFYTQWGTAHLGYITNTIIVTHDPLITFYHLTIALDIHSILGTTIDESNIGIQK
jgi:hypothetical protein